jgi:NADH-quinone oxidoreductase subunit J
MGPGGQIPIPGGLKIVGTLMAVGLGGMLLWALSRLQAMPYVGDAQAADRVSSVKQIGVVLFRDHAFAFEVTSILILVAMVGAVVLAKKNV